MSENARTPHLPQQDRLSESNVYILTTSVLHLIIALSFTGVFGKISAEQTSSFVSLVLVSGTWSVLFAISGLVGIALYIMRKRDWYWFASSLFASVCCMWAAMGVFIFSVGHVDFARIALWLYLAILHTQRARHKPFDYDKAYDLLHQMTQLRDKSAATTLSSALNSENCDINSTEMMQKGDELSLIHRP